MLGTSLNDLEPTPPFTAEVTIKTGKITVALFDRAFTEK
jgi:hypothetical protein